jgi:hypothetical protein
MVAKPVAKLPENTPREKLLICCKPCNIKGFQNVDAADKHFWGAKHQGRAWRAGNVKGTDSYSIFCDSE